MLFIGDSIAVVGFTECGAIGIDPQLTPSEQVDFEFEFLSKPSELLSTLDDQFDDFNINNYLLTPLLFDSKVKLCAYEKFMLAPYIQYSVSGQTSLNGKVYLSITNSSYDDFTKKVLYETEINSGTFNFNFDTSSNQLCFEKGSTIVIWAEITELSGQIVFTPILEQLSGLEDLRVTFYTHSAPNGKNDKLTIKGTTKNLYGSIYGTIIYNENLLDQDSLRLQKTVVDYFTRLQNNQDLTSQEWASFRGALAAIRRGSDGIDNSSYMIDLTTNGGPLYVEGEAYATDFYLWVEHGQTDPSVQRSISVNKKEGDGGHDGLDIQWVGCLAGDTPIIMADGTKKELQNLTAEEWVLDINGEKTKILKIEHNAFDPFHTLYFFENGIIIDEVGSHRFYNVEKGYWEHLYKWKPGEHALDVDGNKIKFLSKEKIFERKERFCLTTESGRYYANGLLSGPARCNKELLEDITLKDAAKMLTTITSSQALSLLDIGEIV